jgi:integrase
VKLHEYARAWVERYQGRGRRGFREGTRDGYRQMLERYALSYFSSQIRLTDVSPRRVAEFLAWVCRQTRPAPMKDDPDRRVPLSDSTVRNALTPLRACLASAVREGLIRTNPAREVDLPHRPRPARAEEDEVQAMSRSELATLLSLLPSRWRLFFWLLAATGLRISEAIALQWCHVRLDGSTPHVRVRRALVRGRIQPPKSRYGRRQIPLEHPLVLALRGHRLASGGRDEDLVFCAANGSPMNPGNLRRRVLKPVAQEANLAWVGFHSFRHTCASLLFAEGRNAVQVQRWLGHHSAAFTLATYVHLLDGDLGEPLAVDAVVGKRRSGRGHVFHRPSPAHTRRRLAGDKARSAHVRLIRGRRADRGPSLAGNAARAGRSPPGLSAANDPRHRTPPTPRSEQANARGGGNSQQARKASRAANMLAAR